MAQNNRTETRTARAPMPYADSGLDWVLLANGYTVHDTLYGRGISIQNVDGLLDVIARTIIVSPNKIRGQEVRFIRSMLDLSQEALGRVLGVTRVQVNRWERDTGKAIPGTADRALRLFYAGKIGGDKLVREICDLLTEIDELEHAPGIFEETRQGWQRKKAA